MKKLILILLIFQFIKLNGQNEYPKMSIDSTGNKVVILSIEQAQIIDNKLELLPLYEKMSTEIGSIDSSCIKTIYQKDEIINSQDKLIKSQKELIKGKQEEILNLNLQIKNYKLTEETYKKEIDNKNKEINLHLDKLDKMKIKVLIGGVVGFSIGFITNILIQH